MTRWMIDADVMLWGRRIGAVTWDEARALGVFQYDPEFVAAGIEVAPLKMPVREAPYEFPDLRKRTFMGLPGMLADALPDRFGNRLIDAWLAETGRSTESFSPVDRLCYIGDRGTGALEFEPATRTGAGSRELEVARLVDLANTVLRRHETLGGQLGGEQDAGALEDILSVGTSAGGARAKAVLAWNRDSGEFRSGQVTVGEGYEHWLLKFDGVADERGKELAHPQGFGKIEYAYHLMAREAGIEMMECRLHQEGGRSHFMTRRFDRDERGRKIHMQSLGAMQHFDFNDPASYSYEQAIQTLRALGLGMDVVEQQYRRAVFNVMARNQDDHVKNISFLMDRSGSWRLSPAYDVVYAYNPSGTWTGDHQMSLAGKRNDFIHDDLMVFADHAGLKPARARRSIDEVAASIAKWTSFAERANVEPSDAARIQSMFRLNLHSK